MKNYKTIRNFYEAMQQKPHQHEERNAHDRQRVHHEKQDSELTLKKVIDFFKSIKP
jgi:hypothetical protein